MTASKIVDINAITRGLCFSAVIVNTGKVLFNRPELWRTMGLRPSRSTELFEDKHMRLFQNTAAEDMLLSTLNVWQLGMPVRHKEMNDRLEEMVMERGVRQVVILGSGFDIRPITYSNLPVRFVEADSAALFSVKAAILTEHGIKPNSTFLSLDYVKENLVEKLLASGIDFSTATHFIWEGNSMYIPKAVIIKLWSGILSEFTAPITLSMDYFSEDFVTGKTSHPSHKAKIESFRRAGISFITGYNDITELAKPLKVRVERCSSLNELILANKVHNESLPELDYYRIALLTNHHLGPASDAPTREFLR